MLSVDICHDILAIRCIDDYVFVGIGTKLNIFSNIDLKCKSIIETGHQNIIHDIVQNGSNKLIIFGGKYLSIFSYEIIEDKIIVNKLSEHIFNDWIISSNFFSINNTEDIYVLFAHNNLYLYNTSSKKYTNVLCEEKCILYSGCISAEKDQVVVLSGTVFKEILIWTVNTKIDNSKDVKVFYRLKGHKGVIFSIFYDQQQKLISSTSDDRTVRLWQIKNPENETDNWSNLTIVLKATMFGHTARVWKSLIVNDKIISVGEDSYIFIWTLEGEVCNKIIAHEGSAVWTLEVSKDKSTIFTGGANGGVNCWPLNKPTPELLPKLSFTDKQIPKYLSYLHCGTLVIFVDNGQLLTYDRELAPKDSIILPRYKSYCLMQVSPNRKLIAFASKDGHVDLFHEVNDKLELFKDDERVMETKIYSIQWLDDSSMLICGDAGHLKVLKINDDNKFDVQNEFILPASRECWTTSAIMINNLIICGDRAGNVYGFNTKSENKNPQYNFNKIHGRLGVQSFGIMNNKLISTGRDATLRFYKLIINDNNDTLLKVLDAKKMPMEWVSRTLKTNNDFFVIGFKEIEFIIYSMRLNRLVLRITCGGGHRSWDCIYMNDVIKFSCIKNKQVYTTDNILCQFSDTLITGFHTREIHSIEILPTMFNKKHMIFISASEDCTLRLSNLQLSETNDLKLNYLDTYYGHISNVKAIAVINLVDTHEETKNLMFTVGGRAQLKVWEISIDLGKNILTNNDVTVAELAKFMIRDIDKSRRKTWQQKQQTYFIDPETRFMDVQAYLQSENKIIIFIACSDGFLRIMSYDISLRDIKMVNEISYYNRCIIKIHTFVHEKELILISMATDGFINLWSVNSMIEESLNDKSTKEPFKLWISHQSGINSYDFCVKFYGENNFASVAIDQRIVMYHYSFNKSILSVTPLIKLIKLTSVADVHGLTFLSNNSNNKQLGCVYGQGIEVIQFDE
ncbi:Similar to Wdr6: WD repeat-containing protein 6 (Mus musculus) [Cotesia congregata]|uniref:tRNA (34-2'-O)-methyltransferase regulator WDR6 n=1 Tax=Cotesia congregata TaxID=51543 RepID=A0A8J2HND9_COTCN|nr:Similar to Wdr6: WD repeat-containing protein 6 (Mus musculus) [Cotesia congregata]